VVVMETKVKSYHIEPVVMIYNKALNVDMKGHDLAYNVHFLDEFITPRIKRIILACFSGDINDNKVIFKKVRNANKHMIMSSFELFVDNLNHEYLHDTLLDVAGLEASKKLDEIQLLDEYLLEDFIKAFKNW